jgi:hypothetical protein
VYSAVAVAAAPQRCRWQGVRAIALVTGSRDWRPAKKARVSRVDDAKALCASGRGAGFLPRASKCRCILAAACTGSVASPLPGTAAGIVAFPRVLLQPARGAAVENLPMLLNKVRTGLLSLAVGSAACHVEPQPLPPYAARPVVELSRSEILNDNIRIGTLVQLAIEDPQGAICYFRVEDLRGAWVGHITTLGRFSKRMPFLDDEQDLGLWPMQKGIAKLFEIEGAVDLKELPVAVPATFRKNS